jgi:drug/metabolite transporter (DMT)-like permease
MIVAGLIVAAIFGLTPILNKFILGSITVETLMIVSGVLFGLIAAAYGVFCCADKVTADLRTIAAAPYLGGLVALSAVLIFVVANYLYLSAIRDHATYLVTAITASYPLVTVVAGALLFREAISVAQFVGVLMIVGGVWVLS